MKFKFKPAMLLGFAMILTTSMFTACGGSDTDKVDKKNDRRKIVIGLDDTFVPMGFREENGELTGFDVDLATKALTNLGYEFEFQPINWDMKETELNNNKIDAIWNGYTKTPERMEKVALTDAYMHNTQAIITLSNSPINSKADLKDKTIATQIASSSLDAINKDKDMVSSIKDGEPILFDTFNEAFMDLEAGRVDAVVADEILARYYISKKDSSKYKVLKDNLADEEYCVGLRKDDTKLLDALNSEFVKMKESGEFDQIKDKWFK
ncbi:MAG: amino acid ABC transporter substrate-binding protein [Sarcina sp.]